MKIFGRTTNEHIDKVIEKYNSSLETPLAKINNDAEHYTKLLKEFDKDTSKLRSLSNIIKDNPIGSVKYNDAKQKATEIQNKDLYSEIKFYGTGLKYKIVKIKGTLSKLKKEIDGFLRRAEQQRDDYSSRYPESPAPKELKLHIEYVYTWLYIQNQLDNDIVRIENIEKDLSKAEKILHDFNEISDSINLVLSLEKDLIVNLERE